MSRGCVARLVNYRGAKKKLLPAQPTEWNIFLLLRCHFVLFEWNSKPTRLRSFMKSGLVSHEEEKSRWRMEKLCELLLARLDVDALLADDGNQSDAVMSQKTSGGMRKCCCRAR